MATQYQPPAFPPVPQRKKRPALVILLVIVILGVCVLLFAGCAALLVSGAKEVSKNPEVNAGRPMTPMATSSPTRRPSRTTSIPATA